jgi:hypothetical protein
MKLAQEAKNKKEMTKADRLAVYDKIVSQGEASNRTNQVLKLKFTMKNVVLKKLVDIIELKN